MKKLWVYIKLLFVSSLAMFFLVFAQKRYRIKKIAEIRVRYPRQEARFTTPANVEKILKTVDKDLMIKPVSEINLYDLEKHVKAHDMIESAEIYIDHEAVLYVDNIERVPIARLRDGFTEYYMDRNGLDMPLSEAYSPRVPLVTGVRDDKGKAELFKLLKFIEQDDFFRKQIIGINRKDNGDFVLSTRIGKAKILLGDTRELKNKFHRLKVFYHKVWNTDTINLYKILNVKYHRQVIGVK